MRPAKMLRGSINPYRWFSDSIPVILKVYWKNFIVPWCGGGVPSQVIIPETRNHGSWHLGVQPTVSRLRGLLRKFNKKTLYLINMLTPAEQLSGVKKGFLKSELLQLVMMQCPWFDHGYIDYRTGKLQQIGEFVAWQQTIAQCFRANNEQLFYCHCMAGKSRSLVETLAFLYFQAENLHLFDFAAWPSEQRALIPLDLQQRLSDYPALSDLAEFVKILRPNVKSLSCMDGDQVGILGLLTLYFYASALGLAQITRRDFSRLCRDAQNLGLLLHAPLDGAFRSVEERTLQEEQLALVYNRFSTRGCNLLLFMIVPIGYHHRENLSIRRYFRQNFSQLKPSQQLRWLILLQSLKQRGCDLSFLAERDFSYCIKQVVTRLAEVTAGDQVEFLRTYPALTQQYLDPRAVVKKIVHGRLLDRYNGGLQLHALKQLFCRQPRVVDYIESQFRYAHTYRTPH